MFCASAFITSGIQKFFRNFLFHKAGVLSEQFDFSDGDTNGINVTGDAHPVSGELHQNRRNDIGKFAVVLFTLCNSKAPAFVGAFAECFLTAEEKVLSSLDNGFLVIVTRNVAVIGAVFSSSYFTGDSAIDHFFHK